MVLRASGFGLRELSKFGMVGPRIRTQLNHQKIYFQSILQHESSPEQKTRASPRTSANYHNFSWVITLNYLENPRTLVRPAGSTLPNSSKLCIHKGASTTAMAITRSGQTYGLSSVKEPLKVKATCPKCEVPIDKSLCVRNKPEPEHSFGPFPVKIILNVRVPCPACKATFDQLLSRRTRIHWTKKTIQKWAKDAPALIVHRIVFKKKRYIVKFYKGTTIKLRNGEKVSTLRIPNRWTRVNEVNGEWVFLLLNFLVN